MPHSRREIRLNRYQDCPVRMACPGRRTRIVTRISKGILFVLLAILSSIIGVPFHSGAAVLSHGNNGASNTSGTYGSQVPQSVGADVLLDLRLPKSVLFTVKRLRGSCAVSRPRAEKPK